MRVLIGFAEAVSAPETVFSLLDAGHEIGVFARSGAALPLFHLPVAAHAIAAPEADLPRAMADLDALLDQGWDAVFALDDTGLWLTDKVLASRQGDSPLSVSETGEQAAVALDKEAQIAAARAAGIAVPDTVVIRDPADLADLDLPLPVIVKPALAMTETPEGLAKGDAHYAPDRETLRALAQRDDLMLPLLVQPLIPGVGEGIFGFAAANGITAWSGHRRVRMMNPHGSGSSACISHMPGEEDRRKVAAMIAAIGWRGPFMMEFLRDETGTPWFMELNGRLWGSLALARRGGFEYPAWAVAAAHDPAFTPKDPAALPTPFVARHLGRDLMHLAFVLKGPKSAFHRRGWPGFWRSLAGVFTPVSLRHFYNYDPRFKTFFLREAFWVIRQQIRKAR